MTKAKVVAVLMERTGLSRRDATVAVEVFMDQVKAGLSRDEKVSLVGFGTFYVKVQRARQGRNPRTGQSIAIPEKRVTVFKPGKSFRAMVNGLSEDEVSDDDGGDE
ncbi:MAG: HU family DNA-binding protein [Candidatus Sumerlaeia bacterium]|nr:HU family DNA-binding protein [Candidatus Sumerlaeia bacterium]